MNIPDHVKGETCRRLATCAWSRAPDWVTTADCYEVRVMTPQSSRRHVLSPHAPSWPAWALWAWVSAFREPNGQWCYSHRASLQLQSQSYTLHSYCTRASTDGTGNCSRYVRAYPVKIPSNFGPHFSPRSDRFDRFASGRPERNVMDRTMAMRKKNR